MGTQIYSVNLIADILNKQKESENVSRTDLVRTVLSLLFAKRILFLAMLKNNSMVHINIFFIRSAHVLRIITEERMNYYLFFKSENEKSKTSLNLGD